MGTRTFSGILVTAVAMSSMGRGHCSNGPERNARVAAAMGYLNHLRSCTAFTYKYPEPLAHSIGENTITGKSGNACKVTLLVPNSYRAECEFSPAAIKALAGERKRREARAGKLTGSLSEIEGKHFGKECQWVFFPK